MMRLVLAFLILSFCAISSRAQEELNGQMPEELMPGMIPVIHAALEGSTDIEMLTYTEREAEGQRLVQRSVVLPTMRTTVSARKEEDQDKLKTTGFEDRIIYRVSIAQPIYHWGARRAQKQMGDIMYESEKLNAERTGMDVLQKVRRDYMALVIAKQSLDVANQMLESKRGGYEFQKKQLEAGAISSAVVEQSGFAVERLELARLKAQNDWEGKLLELASYIGMSVGELEKTIADSIPEFSPISAEDVQALERFFDEGLEQNLALQKKDLDVAYEKKRLKIEQTGLRPKLDAEVGMSSNALDQDGVRREQEFLYFGVNINWNIFDGFRTKGRKIEAVNRLARVERSREILEESVLRNYSRLASALEIARRSLEIEEQELELEREQLERVRQGAEEQRVSPAELGGAELAFAQASISVQRARISYLSALSEFTLLLGLDPVAFESGN